MGGEDSPLPLIYTQMKNQTAIDVFCLTITDHIEGNFNGSIQQDEFAKRMRQSYNEAKALEKEQIMDAYGEGFSNGNRINFRNRNEYYNETYNNTQL